MSDIADVSRGTSQTPARVSDTVDLSAWLTKQQAAAAIGVSTKAIERFTQAGKLEQRMRPQARGPAVAVYYPEDVAKLAAERQPAAKPFVLDADREVPANGNGHGGRKLHSQNATSALAPIQTVVDNDPLSLFAAALVHAVMSQTSQTPPSPPVAEKLAETQTLFLTVEQAAVWTGLTPRELRRAIRRGELAARNSDRRDWRTWKIRRTDLETL